MKIAGILPHLQIYGGVRRYIEIGNELNARGHDFTLYTPQADPPTWIQCRSKVKYIDQVIHDRNDVAIGGSLKILPFLERANARKKIFYAVIEKIPNERNIYRNRNLMIMANSSGLLERIQKKYRVPCLDGIGGINPEAFFPKNVEKDKNNFKIMCYGRLSRRRKGSRQVIKAVELLYQKYPRLELILFDSITKNNEEDPFKELKTKVACRFYLNLPQKEMAGMYSSADIFVSAEKNAGWSNTSAEAMACGVPVICTTSGTRDFAVHGETALVIPNDRPKSIARAIESLMQDKKLRDKLAQNGYNKIQEFSWKKLCDKLERIFSS
jgi:glycosyltransferase involved in cell wall biosynthesis